jgi:hypothetical protein
VLARANDQLQAGHMEPTERVAIKGRNLLAQHTFLERLRTKSCGQNDARLVCGVRVGRNAGVGVVA